MLGAMDNFSQMAAEALTLIQDSRRILLHCHPRPDPDSVGSALGLRAVLRALGRDADIIAGDSPVPDFAEYLPGSETILRQTFNETKLDAYDLFIILDSSSPDMITAAGPVVFPPGLRTLVIDHHITNAGFGASNIVLPTAAATAEIIARLARAWGVTLDVASARPLLIGIYFDTGGFQYAPTSAETFQVAAMLAAADPDYHVTIARIEQGQAPDTISGAGIAFSNIELWGNGTVAVATIPHRDIVARNLDTTQLHAGALASQLISVRDWQVGVVGIEEAPGTIKFSFRAKAGSGRDVSALAHAFGGGGHPAAAGATLSGTLESAVAEIKTACARAFDF